MLLCTSSCVGSSTWLNRKVLGVEFRDLPSLGTGYPQDGARNYPSIDVKLPPFLRRRLRYVRKGVGPLEFCSSKNLPRVPGWNPRSSSTFFKVTQYSSALLFNTAHSIALPSSVGLDGSTYVPTPTEMNPTSSRAVPFCAENDVFSPNLCQKDNTKLHLETKVWT